jgi:hypothetical protein
MHLIPQHDVRPEDEDATRWALLRNINMRVCFNVSDDDNETQDYDDELETLCYSEYISRGCRRGGFLKGEACAGLPFRKLLGA